MLVNDRENIRLFRDAIPDPVNPNHRKLTVTRNSSVQPVSLLRLGVFVPNTRTKGQPAKDIIANDTLGNLEFAQREGYTNIVITGPQLNYFTDFRCWLGIIRSFSTSPEAELGNKISLGFKEFVKFCEYPSKRIDSKLRKDIVDSITRIRAKTIKFYKNNNKAGYITGLLKTAEFNVDKDIIILEADERLWEIYSVDHLLLLRRGPLLELPRNETAQALYTFIEALPSEPVPLNFKRLRERLLMNGRVAEQNRKIFSALDDLCQIGYLKYHIAKDGNESILHIKGRNPTLGKEKEKY